MIQKSLIALCLMGLMQPAFASERGYLGVWFGVLPAREKPEQSGVTVNKVFPGSAAQRAGLKPGQIVLKIDGVAVRDPKTAVSLVSENAAGEKVWLTVIDPAGGGKRPFEIVAVLAASPPGEFASIMTAKRLPRLRPAPASAACRPGCEAARDAKAGCPKALHCRD